jgi:hypothetical protein
MRGWHAQCEQTHGNGGKTHTHDAFHQAGQQEHGCRKCDGHRYVRHGKDLAMCRGPNLGPHDTRYNAEGTVAGFGFSEGRERAGRTCARRAEIQPRGRQRIGVPCDGGIVVSGTGLRAGGLAGAGGAAGRGGGAETF